MGVLIAVDGVDASGKQTQTELLKSRLGRERAVRLVSFPAYESRSSELVKMYLNGDFGKNPEDVNAYAASVFFAADRYATFKSDWGRDYAGGKIIIADRYVSSNMIHQAGKIDDPEGKEKFLEWLHDLEYNKLGLPKPDITIFLDMPPEYGARLMRGRANKITGRDDRDIHESNAGYLKRSYDNALFAAKNRGWHIIPCVKNGAVRSIEDIHGEIYKTVTDMPFFADKAGL